MTGQMGPGQKHLYSRTSYLYQAATYLASIESSPKSVSQTIVEEAELDADHMNMGEADQLVQSVKPGFEYDLRKTDIQDGETPDSISVQQ